MLSTTATADSDAKMAAHYDKHSSKFSSEAEAEAARRSGASYPLRQYHNQVKRMLIDSFVSQTKATHPSGPSVQVRVLDLASGRGGDLNKWNDSGVRQVVGLDISKGECQEANQRFAQMRQQRRYVHV